VTRNGAGHRRAIYKYTKPAPHTANGVDSRTALLTVAHTIAYQLQRMSEKRGVENAHATLPETVSGQPKCSEQLRQTASILLYKCWSTHRYAVSGNGGRGSPHERLHREVIGTTPDAQSAWGRVTVI
jgi:hypothetical protein